MNRRHGCPGDIDAGLHTTFFLGKIHHAYTAYIRCNENITLCFLSPPFDLEHDTCRLRSNTDQMGNIVIGNILADIHDDHYVRAAQWHHLNGNIVDYTAIHQQPARMIPG